MIHILGDYYFESDGVRNFSLYKKGVVSEDNGRGKKAKPENVGKEKFEPLGFYSSVESLLNGLIQKAALDAATDRSVKELSDLVVRIHATIDQITRLFQIDPSVASNAEKKMEEVDNGKKVKKRA